MKRILIALTLSLLATSCSNSTENSQFWPSVQVLDVSGNEKNSDQFFHQKYTVVTLWSTTCVPCRVELPQLQDFASQHADIDVVAFNLGDNPQSVMKFVQDFKLSIPIAIDFEGRVSSALEVTTVPATLLFSPSGQVLDTHVGEITSGELAQLVERSS